MKKNTSFTLFNLIAVILTFHTQLYAQVLKTFSGDYEDGKVTYQYFEDPNTAEYIKHGSFKFEKNMRDNIGTYSHLVTGNFKNGYRDGEWRFSINKKDILNNSGTYTTQTISSVQTFKDGLPNGLWKVSNSWKTRQLMFGTWQPFSSLHTENASTTFIKGVATGITSFAKPQTLTVKFNQSGFLVGDYVFQGIYDNTEISCNESGVVTKFVSRSKTGEVNEKKSFDLELLSIASKYLSGEIPKSDVIKQRIKIDTVYGGTYIDYGSLFEQDYFLMPNLGGDKTYDGSSSTSNRIYSRYILAQRIKVFPYEEHQAWSGSSYTDEGKISDYTNFLELYSSEISDADVATIKQLIIQAQAREKERISAEQQREMMLNKNNVINNALTLDSIKIYRGSVINMSVDKGLAKQIAIRDSVRNHILRKIWFKEGISYSERLKSADESLVSLKTIYLPIRDSINRIQRKAAQTDSILSKVERSFNNVNYGQEVIGFPSPEKTISPMYQAYRSILNSLLRRIESESQYPILENYFNKIVLICNKAAGLINKDNTELLKKLKKLKTDEEKMDTFLL